MSLAPMASVAKSGRNGGSWGSSRPITSLVVKPLTPRFSSDAGQRDASRAGKERSGADPVPMVNESPTATYLAGIQGRPFDTDAAVGGAEPPGGGAASRGGAFAHATHRRPTRGIASVYAGGDEWYFCKARPTWTLVG